MKSTLNDRIQSEGFGRTEQQTGIEKPIYTETVTEEKSDTKKDAKRKSE